MKILQAAALLLAVVLVANLAVHGLLGAILEATALFLTLAVAINLAVYGWLSVVGAWPDGKGETGDRLVHLLTAAVFTAMAALTWYALAFVVRPFG